MTSSQRAHLEGEVARGVGQVVQRCVHRPVHGDVPRGCFREAHPGDDAQRVGDRLGGGGRLLSLLGSPLQKGIDQSHGPVVRVSGCLKYGGTLVVRVQEGLKYWMGCGILN